MMLFNKKFLGIFFAVLFTAMDISSVGAEPVIMENEAELLASPYYNMDLADPVCRDSIYDPAATIVNPVQNQGIFGTCWAFAAVASAESSVYNQLRHQGIPYNVETNYIKYSPWALAWLKSAPPVEVDVYDEKLHPSAPLSEEYMQPFSSKVYRGGLSYLDLEFNMSMGIGLKKMKIGDKKDLIAPADYTDEDDIHLHNCFIVDNLQEPENISRAKKMLLEYGAAVAGISAEGLFQDNAVDFYRNKALPADHAVTVIGWDDDYDFSASGMRVAPEHKGAWIIRNSWGRDWADKGDCYLSYEDKGIELFASLDMDLDADCFDNIATHEDFYDGARYGEDDVIYNVELPASASFASAYMAKENEFIKAVGMYVADDGMAYNIRIYRDCDKMPLDGRKPDYEQEGIFGEDGTPELKGYRTVQLAQPVSLAKGQKYLVEVSLVDRDGNSVFTVAVDLRETDVEEVTSYINEGRGKWQKVFDPHAEYKNKIFEHASVIQRIYLKNSGE